MSTKKGKLKLIAEKRGVTVQQLVVTTVAREGSILAAATALGVTPNTIHYHKNKFGLVLTRKTELGMEQAS